MCNYNSTNKMVTLFFQNKRINHVPQVQNDKVAKQYKLYNKIQHKQLQEKE